MTAQVKKCVDCRYALAEKVRYRTADDCRPAQRHEYLCGAPDARMAEPVGGYMLTCIEQRKAGSLCGPDAQLYEKRG